MKGLLLLTLCALLPGCKDRSSQDQEQSSAPAPAVQLPTTAIDRDDKPTTETPPLPVTELPLVLFEAATGMAHVASWPHHSQSVIIRALPVRHPDGKHVRVEVVADPSDDREQQQLSVCSDLSVNAAGRVELTVRGDYLHVLCINPPLDNDLGWTEAVRFRLGTSKLELAGNYSGEGIVNPDTIDLDEADIVDDPP